MDIPPSNALGPNTGQGLDDPASSQRTVAFNGTEAGRPGAWGYNELPSSPTACRELACPSFSVRSLASLALLGLELGFGEGILSHGDNDPIQLAMAVLLQILETYLESPRSQKSVRFCQGVVFPTVRTVKLQTVDTASGSDLVQSDTSLALFVSAAMALMFVNS